MLGSLFIVGTPIGNLSDITERAKKTFEDVDVVLCEDTRVTQHMLHAFGMKKTLMSYHQHSDDLRVKDIVSLLKEGKSLALVSDAGTPGISDPGGMLVEALVKMLGDELKIIPIPGPSALISALSISGFPADEFLFLGFPPHKKGRQTYFKRLSSISSTMVYYESTHRIEKSMQELADVVGDRSVVVCRELTKIYETIYRGSASEILAKLKTTSLKGEFVVVIGPKRK
jgi:16S rRNA (cytidine1402-2'-O)-methyltransferase